MNRKINLIITITVTLLSTLAVVIAFAAPTLTKDAFSSILSPLILGTASIVLSLGARNASISERMRTNAKSLLEAKAAMQTSRAESLSRQLLLFRVRFNFNQTALLLQMIVLPLFMAMYVFSATDNVYLASRMFFMAIGLSIIGFALTILDLSFGWVTFGIEAKYADTHSVTPVASERLLLKSLDVLIFCQNQYDTIRFSHAPRVDNQGEATVYWSRYWNHQMTQFEFYTKGVLEPDTFRFWMECRRQDHDTNEAIAGVTFQDGWAQSKKLLNNAEFNSFMTLVFQDSVAAAIRYVEPKLVHRGI